MILKNERIWRSLTAVVFLLTALQATAQDSIPRSTSKYIFFPYPVPNKAWHSSLGFTMTSMPQDITEEVAVRAPAGDYHVLRGLPKGFYLDGRINFQVVQNHASIGVRWATPIDDKLSISFGDDFGFWYGKLTVASFDTKSHGWMNYPNFSLGYRVRKDLLFTIKGELMINLTQVSTVAGITVRDGSRKFSGFGTTIMLEQPFYSKKSVSLGVRAMYTDFFWQTWSLYETFDRKIFYPEIIIGFIF